tara:strand:+ start:936 stop:1757 length:822 start_codon:yes stop_codon:yes gene_type:complete
MKESKINNAFQEIVSNDIGNLKVKEVVKKIKNDFNKKNNTYLLINLNEKNPKRIKDKTNLVSSLLGKRVNQNKKGEKILTITPNLRMLKKNKNSLDKNIRYHQTNTGGSIHTDGPQLIKTPNILIMSCINNALKGGDTVLVDANKIYLQIKKNKPSYLNELSKNFYFERRGFDFTKNYLKKPILEKKGNKIYLRYLKEYILEGYKKAKKDISIEKIKAIKYLDKTMSLKKNQITLKMKKGDLIIINNKSTAHGRTSFTLNKKTPRKFLRIWVN